MQQTNQYNRVGETLRHQDILDNYLTYVGLSRTEETVGLYKAKLTVLIRAFDALNPEQWTKIAFERYIGDGKAGRLNGQVRKWTVRTVQMHLQSAALFGRWCRSHDIPCPEFWVGVQKPRSVTKEAGFYTLEEARKLLDAAALDDSPWHARIALAFGCGMRRMETTRARWEDLDFDKRTVKVRREKTGMMHTIPMSPFVYDALYRYRKAEGPVVLTGTSNSTRDMQRLCTAAGIKYRSFHALRHGFASLLLAKQVPSHVVAKLGGWKDLKTLGRYSHPYDGAAESAVANLA